MPEILLVSRDSNLITTMQTACCKSSINLALCSDAKSAGALLKGRKFYAVMVDDCDRAATRDFLATVREMPSSAKAMSIVFAEGPTIAVSDAALVVAKPVSMELAMRTLRAAKGPITNEFRRYVRHAVEIPITVTTGEKYGVNARLLNISDGGLAVQLADRSQLPITTTVSARFALPVSGDWVQVEGDVVWCDAEGRAGLRCSGVTNYDRERLRKWIAGQVGGPQ